MINALTVARSIGLHLVPDQSAVDEIVESSGWPERTIRTLIDFAATEVVELYITEAPESREQVLVLTSVMQEDFISTWRMSVASELRNLSPLRLIAIEEVLY